jgi:hypothetical protein
MFVILRETEHLSAGLLALNDPIRDSRYMKIQSRIIKINAMIDVTRIDVSPQYCKIEWCLFVSLAFLTLRTHHFSTQIIRVFLR